MANLNYKVTDIKFEPSDDSVLVFIDISSDAAPDCLANAALDYIFNVQGLQIDVEYGDATYVPYGSTYVLYDDGFSLEGVDASDAIDFGEYYICDADNEIIWGLEEFKAAQREAAKLLNCTEEELTAFFDKIKDELFSTVCKTVEDYYMENSDRIPERVWEAHDDWYDVDWD